ncbi:exported hypothetical protein [Burkholderiales bacterium]|nr:exported hypothetical protein [Burkholderiales bacterium]
MTVSRFLASGTTLIIVIPCRMAFGTALYGSAGGAEVAANGSFVAIVVRRSRGQWRLHGAPAAGTHLPPPWSRR